MRGAQNEERRGRVSCGAVHSQAREMMTGLHGYVGGCDVGHQPVRLVLPEKALDRLNVEITELSSLKRAIRFY